MSMSIRDPRAKQLAGEISEETGESLTQAIIKSLQERLERLRGRRRVNSLLEDILEISVHCRNLPDIDMRTPEEILGYGEHGVSNHGH